MFEVWDVFELSSGKLGGEKELFVGIIVVVSFVYVLIFDGYDRLIYCMVFLDEVFFNIVEVVSCWVFWVFKELYIYVNLIIFYKNFNLVREFVWLLFIVECDLELYESYLCEVIWEEID